MLQQPALPRICVIGDFLVKGGWKIGPRINTEYELLLFPQASDTVFLLDRQPYELNEPCVLLIPPRVTHEFRSSSGRHLRHLFIHFDHTPESLQDPIRDIPAFVPVSRTVIAEKMFTHILCLADQQPPRWKERACASLYLLLEELASLNQEQEPREQDSAAHQSRQIEQAIEYMNARLDEEIAIKDIAAHVGWTHEYFTRTFTSHMSVPPQQYILQRRIERACELLVTENWSVKEIAYSIGFQSEPYFCRVFRKMKGVTASRYREINDDPNVKNLYLAVKHDQHLSHRQNTYYFA
ncbi:helix-turn-helix transcriptional regulator [Cohnella cellulosilytica]|uniref:AraC family transcriptional regulator n=1 Tax=Cohnella cellulosilytica TaxID=986710 RepID=A0ABW2FI32_9BACL